LFWICLVAVFVFNPRKTKRQIITKMLRRGGLEPAVLKIGIKN